jgi:hypothetical protein
LRNRAAFAGAAGVGASACTPFSLGRIGLRRPSQRVHSLGLRCPAFRDSIRTVGMAVAPPKKRNRHDQTKRNELSDPVFLERQLPNSEKYRAGANAGCDLWRAGVCSRTASSLYRIVDRTNFMFAFGDYLVD